MDDSYTREEIESGRGFYCGDRRTMIYRRPDGRYVTAEKSDRPGSALVLVGGGFLQPDGTPEIDWCE